MRPRCFNLCVILHFAFLNCVMATLLRKCCPEKSFLMLNLGSGNEDFSCFRNVNHSVPPPTKLFSSRQDVHFVFVRKFSCRKYLFLHYEDLLEKIPLRANGAIIIRNQHFGPDFYCSDAEKMVDGGNAVAFREVLVVCLIPDGTSSGAGRVLVPKCCEANHSYALREDGHGCAETYAPFAVDLYDPFSNERVPHRAADVQTFVQNEDFCPLASQDFLLSTDDAFHVLESGYLFVPDSAAKVFPQEKYCVDDISAYYENGTAKLAVVCRPSDRDAYLEEWLEAEACNASVCVPKCCTGEKALFHSKMCMKYDEGMSFHFRNERGEVVEVPAGEFEVVQHVPRCADGGYLLSTEPQDPDDQFDILPDGRLYFPRWQRIFPFRKFCIDVSFNDSEGTLIAAYCEESYVDEPPHWISVLYPVCMAVSCVLLLVTLLVYSVIVELRNLHGKTLMAYISSLLLAFVCLIVAQLVSKNFSKVPCKTLGVVMLFAFLSSFFWLNVMCFDIWRTFSDLYAGRSRSKDNRRFILYCLYAWGGPFLIGMAVAIIDNVPSVPNTLIKPNIGRQRCWFDFGAGRIAAFAYFYGPIAVILFVNIFFFSMTAVKLMAACKDTNMVRSHKKYKTRLAIYVKLFLVMGLVWVTEVVSWKVGLPQIWYVTDMANTLQGVIIFVIFVCKKKVIRKIQRSIFASRTGINHNSTIKTTTSCMTSINSTTSANRNQLELHNLKMPS